MRLTLSFFLAVAHLVTILGPVSDAHGQATSDEADAKQGLDRRLRQAGQARVWILRRPTPGGQLLAEPHWLLVRSPRATRDRLSFASVVEPASFASGDTAAFSWEYVDEIRVRTSNAGRAALVGGLIMAGAGAGLAVVVSQDALSADDPTAGEVLLTVGTGFVIGALLGALLGSGSRSWEKVYP